MNPFLLLSWHTVCCNAGVYRPYKKNGSLAKAHLNARLVSLGLNRGVMYIHPNGSIDMVSINHNWDKFYSFEQVEEKLAIVSNKDQNLIIN